MADPDQLELKLDAAEVTLSRLVSASSIFAALLREVAKEYSGSDRAVKWVVEVQPGSVRLPVRGLPATDKLTSRAVPEIVGAVVGGLASLDQRAVRPKYFNDQALREAKALANLATEEMGVLVKNGAVSAEATKRLMTHVDEVIGAGRESIGTVEGKLQALNIHERPPRFAIFDLLSDDRIECFFGEHVTLDDVMGGVGRRVAVTGVIKTRPTGERVSIDVRSLRTFPPEDELPTPDDVRGILRLPESA